MRRKDRVKGESVAFVELITTPHCNGIVQESCGFLGGLGVLWRRAGFESTVGL